MRGACVGACAYVMTRGVTRLTRIQDGQGKHRERGSIGSDWTIRHHTNGDMMRMRSSKGQRPKAKEPNKEGRDKGIGSFLQRIAADPGAGDQSG